MVTFLQYCIIYFRCWLVRMCSRAGAGYLDLLIVAGVFGWTRLMAGMSIDRIDVDASGASVAVVWLLVGADRVDDFTTTRWTLPSCAMGDVGSAQGLGIGAAGAWDFWYLWVFSGTAWQESTPVGKLLLTALNLNSHGNTTVVRESSRTSTFRMWPAILSRPIRILIIKWW